ncbi:MAG TPA: serine/threonine-protein kinase [Gemmatimonadaceae bacterium]|nr:serine/threonine-protein kinase [Gemmatimonadaceae bacterium]
MPDSGIAIVGKYRILDLVGEGAMGVVYRGVDTVLNRTVALKVMSESVARQQDLRDRFLREAQAAGSLQHPNVVTIYDFGEVDGHLFIAMEFVDGVDLERLLSAHEPLTLQQRLDIAIDVLTGLCYAHRRGIVHRDIKPANIRITEEGRAKVMDFGVAYLDSSRMTQTGMMMGTPSYMAPEQVVGGKITAATDIFAMGSVLYELLSGARPFEGSTLHNTLYKIVSEDPPPIREVMPGLPASLDRIVRKALQKDPSLRYQDSLEMADDLAAVRAELDAEHKTSSTVSLRRSVETAIASQVKSRMRKRTLAGLAAVLILGAATGGAVWLAMRDRPDPAPAVAQLERGPSAESLASSAEPARLPEESSGETGVAGAADPPGRVDPDPPPPRTAVPPSDSRQATPAAAAPVARRDTPIAQPSPANRLASSRDSAARSRTAGAESTRVPPPIQLPRANVELPPPPVRGNVVTPPEFSDSTLISHAVASYARAIESRDVVAIRRVYPQMTPQQQSAFEQFFRATTDLRVTLRIADLSIGGSTADARVTGMYVYQTSRGREDLPVAFAATLRKEGEVWRLLAVR